MAVRPSSRNITRARSVPRRAARRKKAVRDLWPLAGLLLSAASVATLLWLVFPTKLVLPWAIANGLSLAFGRCATAAILLAMLAGGLLSLGADPRKIGRLAMAAGALLLLAASSVHLALAGNSWEVETLRSAGGHLGFWFTRLTLPLLGPVGHWTLVLFGFAVGGLALARFRSNESRPVGAQRPARRSQTGYIPTTRKAEPEQALASREESGRRILDVLERRTKTTSPGISNREAAGEGASTPLPSSAVVRSPAPVRPMSAPARFRARATPDIGQPVLPFQPAGADGAGYTPPPIDLLAPLDRSADPEIDAEAEEKIAIIEQTLREFGVEATVAEVSRGPSVTRFEVRLAPGVKVNRIVALADNLAMSLAAIDVRIEAPIPGKAAIGVEAPSSRPRTVRLRECLDHPDFWTAPGPLAIPLGMDVAGEIRFADLAKMPHLLVGGSTNTGKSVCLNAMIASLVFRNSPANLRLILIDPKRVELSLWDGIPHLLFPVVRSMKQATGVFRSAIAEMDRRYERFAKLGTRNIEGYNQRVAAEERIPYIVVVVDELADLMMQAAAEAETAICRLAQLARATGIHLVVATQRPSVDVVTGLIKANISSRIAFAVSSQVDSRTILDMNGAERLLGRGDLLYLPIDQPKPVRIQGCFVDEVEIGGIVRHLKEQPAASFEIGPLPSSAELFHQGEAREDVRDDLFEPAVRLVVTTGQASTSMIQRRFKIGYGRAARILDAMETRGVVGPLDGAKPRKVLMNRDEMERMFDG